MSIDQSIIQKARRTDLPSFLKSKGEPLKKSGKRWQHKEHDSLIISGHMFFWNSRQEKGNSLDFVRLFYGWSFEQAIEELTDYEGKTTMKPEPPQEEEPKDLHISQSPDNRRVIAYLCQTRKIKYDLVKRLIDTHYLSQDEHNNAVFKIYNEKGKLIGGELVGTLSTVRFKSIVEGTKTGYGFNVTIGNSEKTLFFESPIDLLSFWTLNEKQLTAHRLVSLAGLRVDIFQNILERFSIDPITAYLCVDNDQAGKAFIQTIRSKYTNIKVHIPQIEKDWNDLLQKKEAVIKKQETERQLTYRERYEQGTHRYHKREEAGQGKNMKEESPPLTVGERYKQAMERRLVRDPNRPNRNYRKPADRYKEAMERKKPSLHDIIEETKRKLEEEKRHHEPEQHHKDKDNGRER